MDAYTLIVPPLMLISCIWVYFDARAIGGEQVDMPGVFGGVSPAMWAIGSLLMWIVVFPAYLFKRGELKRRVAEYRQLPDEYKWDRK